MECTRARGAAPGFKVAVLGASGGIGQPLSLLLKMNPLVSTLHLYDVANTPGVTADLSHTNTSAVVSFEFWEGQVARMWDEEERTGFLFSLRYIPSLTEGF